MNIDVVFFEVRGRRCALPVTDVREVMALPYVTPVPQAPALVRGVVPVHSQVLPLVDLGAQLAPPAEPISASVLRAARSRLLVIEAQGEGESGPLRAALLVDRVDRLGALDERHARATGGPSFVRGVVMELEGPTLLLDAARAIEAVRTAVRERGST